MVKPTQFKVGFLFLGNMYSIYLILTALVGYLIGSVSFARLVTKRWSGQDVTKFEIPVQGTEERYPILAVSGNSVSSVLGAKAGMLVSLLDMLKIIIPTLFCRLYLADHPLYMLVVAAAGVTGHIWPVYHRFHGGTGYSPVVGSLLVIDPLALIVCVVAGIILGMVVLRNIVVASLSWLWLLIPWFWWRQGVSSYLYFAVAVNVLIILAMVPEIKNIQKYSRQGKRAEYGLGSLNSHPMGRGFVKMARIFKVKIQ
jgi:glycerol-3-phosphate acyltransferase PlsY